MRSALLLSPGKAFIVLSSRGKETNICWKMIHSAWPLEGLRSTVVKEGFRVALLV